jgi:hypothetical protein
MELDNDARLLLVLGILFVSIFSVVTIASLSTSYNMPSLGSLIQTIGIEVTEPSVYWGIVTPGSNVQREIHAKNNGTVALQLTISAVDWQPIEATQFLAFSSPDNGVVIAAQETKVITLNLAVSSEIHDIDSFSFNISLVGEQV